MNYFQKIFTCGQDGFCGSVRASLQHDNGDLWKDLSLCEENVPAPPPIPRVIRLTPENMYDGDDNDSLYGLAFVEQAREKGHCFEEFMEMETSVVVDEEEHQPWNHANRLHRERQPSSLSFSVNDNDSCNDGSSYGTGNRSSDLFWTNREQSRGQHRAWHVSSNTTAPTHKKGLSQGTMTTASSYEYTMLEGEI